MAASFTNALRPENPETGIWGFTVITKAEKYAEGSSEGQANIFATGYEAPKMFGISGAPFGAKPLVNA
jgi:hypothetical protein